MQLIKKLLTEITKEEYAVIMHLRKLLLFQHFKL